MSRLLSMGLVFVLVSVILLTGCSSKNKDNTPAAQETPAVEETAPPSSSEPEAPAEEERPASTTVLDAAKFAGIDGSLLIKKANITIDGVLDDWGGIESYYITHDTDGNELKFKSSVSLAWDGGNKLFAKGTVKVPDNTLAAQAKDSAEWWSDDVFELFLISALPNNESENKVYAGHYAFNSQHMFESEDLLKNGKVQSLPVADGKWSFEAEMQLEADLQKALADGALFAKIGVEMNSAGEYSLLGRKGGFWDVDNYIELNPSNDEAAAGVSLNADKFVGIKDTMEVKNASITIDGNLDDWKGIEAFDITKDTDGNDLKFKGNVSLAWDGNHTLYAKGTLDVPDNMLTAQAKDSAEWWSDDVFELFLVSTLPNNESENKVYAGHYAFNSKELFETDELLKNAKVANLPVAKGKWSFEVEIPLEGDLAAALAVNGSLFAKVGVEMNSAGEYSMLGRSGGFWDVDNYINLKFIP